MNFTIYIEDSTGQTITNVAHALGKTRNAIVREAIEEWCNKHAPTQWEPGFFDFEPITDCPNFSQYRHEFEKQPSEDPLA